MRNIESGPNQASILRITEDRDVLARKLEEYRGRINNYRAPETQFDTIYKIAITQALVETGEADTEKIAAELEQEYGTLDTFLFTNACRVIKDYIETGGKMVRGGTGLYGRSEKNTIDDDGSSGKIH